MNFQVKNNINEAKAKFLQALRDSADETKLTVVADVQSVTPVKTGALKRSISGHYRVKNEGLIKIEVGSPLIYAKKVEFENKSYLRSTLDNDSEKISDIFNNHIKGAEL